MHSAPCDGGDESEEAMKLTPAQAKRRKPTPLNARTLQWFKARGWPAQVVEHWIPQTHIRRDLFGFIDIVAMDPNSGRLVGVQVTSGEGGNLRARLRKAQAIPFFTLWQQANDVEFHGWAKRGAKGKRKLWTLRRLDGNGNELAPENTH